MLEASVQDGASIDLVMEKGGLISLTTSWLTIESTQFNAGDVSDDVVVEIDLGDGVVWEMPFDSDGKFQAILPAGSVSFDSEFETVQHDLQLTMEYSAGLSVEIVQDTAEDRLLEFTRKVNSDLVVEVISITEGTAEFDVTDLTDVTAIEDGDGYKVISLELQLTYEGTEISDEFSATGSLGVTQDSEFWKVEYRNSTSDDEGEWSETMDVLMGIGVDNNDTNQVLTRLVDVTYHITSSKSITDLR